MDLLKNLAQQLGVDERQARVVAGTIVEAARQAAPQRVRNDVRRAVPEASSWVLEAASDPRIRARIALQLATPGGALRPLLANLDRLGVDTGAALRVIPIVLGFLEGRMGRPSFDELARTVSFVGAVWGGGPSRPPRALHRAPVEPS